MTIFGNPRGAFRLVDIDGSKGSGAQVEFPKGSVDTTKSIVTSFSSSQNELYGVQNCLNKSTYVYTFGHNPQQSQFTVGMTLFLANCSGAMIGLKQHLAAYAGSRVSEAKGGKLKLTVGGALYSGHLVGQRIESITPELNLVGVSYTCILLEACGG